jgi:hypothetical protein
MSCAAWSKCACACAHLVLAALGPLRADSGACGAVGLRCHAWLVAAPHRSMLGAQPGPRTSPTERLTALSKEIGDMLATCRQSARTLKSCIFSKWQVRAIDTGLLRLTRHCTCAGYAISLPSTQFAQLSPISPPMKPNPSCTAENRHGVYRYAGLASDVANVYIQLRCEVIPLLT